MSIVKKNLVLHYFCCCYSESVSDTFIPKFISVNPQLSQQSSLRTGNGSAEYSLDLWARENSQLCNNVKMRHLLFNLSTKLHVLKYSNKSILHLLTTIHGNSSPVQTENITMLNT